MPTIVSHEFGREYHIGSRSVYRRTLCESECDIVRCEQVQRDQGWGKVAACIDKDTSFRMIPNV
jgi:hypothetical protein